MEGIVVKNSRTHLIISVPISSIIEETKNEDWLISHSIAPVKDKKGMIEYLKIELTDTSIDTGNGFVSPISNMIMDLLSDANEEGADFFDEDSEDDES